MKLYTIVSIIAGICFALFNSTDSHGSPRSEKHSIIHKSQNSKPLDKLLSSGDTLDQHLYTLWIASDSIKNKSSYKRRLLLNFYVNNTNAFTLRGWFLDKRFFLFNRFGNRFNEIPQITLSVIRSNNTSLKIDKGSYLGNVVIRRKNMQKIRQSTKKYLLFVPEINFEKNNPTLIRYKLILTDEDPRKANVKIDVNGDGQLFANPTPPRNYNGNN